MSAVRPRVRSTHTVIKIRNGRDWNPINFIYIWRRLNICQKHKLESFTLIGKCVFLACLSFEYKFSVLYRKRDREFAFTVYVSSTSIITAAAIAAMGKFTRNNTQPIDRNPFTLHHVPDIKKSKLLRVGTSNKRFCSINSNEKLLNFN